MLQSCQCRSATLTPFPVSKGAITGIGCIDAAIVSDRAVPPKRQESSRDAFQQSIQRLQHTLHFILGFSQLGFGKRQVSHLPMVSISAANLDAPDAARLPSAPLSACPTRSTPAASLRAMACCASWICPGYSSRKVLIKSERNSRSPSTRWSSSVAFSTAADWSRPGPGQGPSAAVRATG